MDTEYLKQKLTNLHEQNTELRVQARFLRKKIHMYAFIALIGWGAFVVAVYHYAPL